MKQALLIILIAALAFILGGFYESSAGQKNTTVNPVFPAGSQAGGCGYELYVLAETLGQLQMAAGLKTNGLSQDTRSNIVGSLDFQAKILNHRPMPGKIGDAQRLLDRAITAEIEVLSYEAANIDKYATILEDPAYAKLLEKTMTLRSEAAAEISSLAEKIWKI